MATLVCARACLHFCSFLLCALCVCLCLCVRQRGSPDWPRLDKRPLFDRNATGGCEVSVPAPLMSAPSVCLDFFFLYPRDKLIVFIVKGNYFTSKLVFVPRSDCSLLGRIYLALLPLNPTLFCFKQKTKQKVYQLSGADNIFIKM